LGVFGLGLLRRGGQGHCTQRDRKAEQGGEGKQGQAHGMGSVWTTAFEPKRSRRGLETHLLVKGASSGPLAKPLRPPYLQPITFSEETFIMAITNPAQFIQQTRAEIAKVVWPTRREVVLTTVMVFIMATLTAIFFSLVDLAIRSGLNGVFGLF